MIGSMGGYYVALGDSMSIDDYAGGAGRGAASLLYRNCDIDFPDFAGRDLATAGFSTLMLARDGATTSDVLHRQLPQLTEPADLITITMGGNDLLACYGDDTAAAAAVGRAAALGEGVLSRLRRVRGRTCRVLVSTVYDPSDGAGQSPGAGLPAWPQGPQWVRALNTALADLAHRHDAVLVDLHSRFLGHGVTIGDPAQTDPRPANHDLWFCGVVEPNAWGAHAIRAAWWQALHDLDDGEAAH